MHALNLSNVEFDLAEAIQAVDKAIDEAHSGVFDCSGDVAFSVRLDSGLAHLCLAWNRRYMSVEDRLDQTQEDYLLCSTRIPNFGNSFKLVDMAALDQHRKSDSSLGIDKNTVTQYLVAFKSFMQKVCEYCRYGTDAQSIPIEQNIASVFSEAVSNLCLAWHLRYSSATDLSLMLPAEKNSLEHAIPRWGLDYELIEISER